MGLEKDLAHELRDNVSDLKDMKRKGDDDHRGVLASKFILALRSPVWRQKIYVELVACNFKMNYPIKVIQYFVDYCYTDQIESFWSMCRVDQTER